MTQTRRLNLRALIELTIALVVVVPGVSGLVVYRQRGANRAYLVEAKALFEKKKTALGLGYLNRHLVINPNDLDALDLKAKILAEAATDEAQTVEAARVHSQVLGRTGDAVSRQETRRRLVRLDLTIPGRARAAQAQARALIEGGADDAEAHRLLALALEQIGVLEKKPEAIDEARREYERAEAKAPGDVEGAERLATLYRDRLENPVKAREVLDQLVQSCKGAAPSKRGEAHLARARHFTATRRNDLAALDVELAVKDDPANADVRLAAAELALLRGDASTARKHLTAIDPAGRKDARVLVSMGLIDLVEQRPEEAIKNWRAGLIASEGNDLELTWRLAHVLLETGRVSEAEPLIDQYQRLYGGDDPPPRQRFLKALALLWKNRAAEAVTELEAIRYKVDKGLEPHVFHALGRAYEATREPSRALEAYRQAAEGSRDWSLPWASAARVQLVNHPADAVATLERGLALYPEDPALLIALTGISWRNQVEKLKTKRDWSTFDKLLNRARKAAPAAPELVLIEADYDAAIDKPDAAIELLNAAGRINPKSTELWLARSNALARAGKLGKALDVLEQGLAAAGPQASLYVSKASLLSLKGLYNEARDVLSEGLNRVPDEQKPLLWKNLGDLDRARGDLSSARMAYHSWSLLQPDNPEPRLSLVELALASNDDAAITAAVEAVRGVGGPKSYAWPIARVEELLHNRPGASGPDKLEEAEALIKEIQTSDPKLATGFLLEARLRERKKESDRAVLAYEHALSLESGSSALTPLIALLVREKRDVDLVRLKETIGAKVGGLDRLAAYQALRQGDSERALKLAAMAVQGDPQGIDTRVWQAEVLNALGKPDEAEASLKQVVESAPSTPAPWLQLLMLQISRKKMADAATTVETIKKQVNVAYPEIFWAQCYRAIGDIKNAEQCYDRAVVRWHDVPEVLASAAGFFEQNGRGQKAESALRALLKLDPASGWATRKLAVVLASRQGNRAAWDEALKLIGPEPRPDDVPDDVVARATVYAQSPENGHKRKAIATLNGSLLETPDRRDIHEKLARWLMPLGEIAAARDHAEKAAQGDQGSPEAILLYANLLLANRALDDTEKQLARLIALDPDGLPVAEFKARILSARGRTAEAASVIEDAFKARASAPDRVDVGETAIRLLISMNQIEAAGRVASLVASEPSGARAKGLLATVSALRGEFDEAAGLLAKIAKTADPTLEKRGDPAAALTVAIGLAAMPGADPRWLGQADSYLQQATSSDTPSLDLLEKTSLVRHFQGRYNEEVAAYSSMLQRNPSNYNFLNNMAWTISEEMNRPEVGIKWADDALRRAGVQPRILDTRGVILTRLNRLDEAINDLEAAFQGMPSASVAFHLARAYKLKGRTQDYMKARDRARQAGLNRSQLQRSEQADFDAIMGL